MIKKAIFLSLLLSSQADAFSVYKCEGSNGKINYSDKPCLDNSKESILKTKKENKKKSKSYSSRSKKTHSNRKKSCTEEPEAGWDNATMIAINEKYYTRTGYCTQMYKRGSKQLAVCFDEQETLKNERLDKFYKMKASRC